MRVCVCVCVHHTVIDTVPIRTSHRCLSSHRKCIGSLVCLPSILMVSLLHWIEVLCQYTAAAAVAPSATNLAHKTCCIGTDSFYIHDLHSLFSPPLSLGFGCDGCGWWHGWAATSCIEMSYGAASEMIWAKWSQCHTPVFVCVLTRNVLHRNWNSSAVESMDEMHLAFGARPVCVRTRCTSMPGTLLLKLIWNRCAHTKYALK